MTTMTNSESRPADASTDEREPTQSLEQQVLESIVEVAPDLDVDDLDAGVDLHADIGLDSIDLLNIAAEIAARTGYEIPEASLSRLHTVGALVEFVEQNCDTTS